MNVVRTIKELKEVDVVVEDFLQCDKCGNEIKTGLYDAFSFDFEVRTGESYPEGGNGQLFNMDLCQECFKELLELLKENKYRVDEKEWDS